MIFGVSINNRAATYLPKYGAREMLALARSCEELEFDNVWVHDNIIGNSGYEAIATLSAISAATQTIKVGTSILIPYYRNPILLSQQISTIDHISNGRLILGVGTGGVIKDTMKERREFAGSQKVDPVGLLEEYLIALKTLWTRKGTQSDSKQDSFLKVSFKGKYINFEEIATSYVPLQNPHPPIWIAAGTYHNGRYFGKFDLVAKLADGWFTLRATPEELEIALKKIAELRSKYGRNLDPFTSCIEFWFLPDSDKERAFNSCRNAISKYLGKEVSDQTVSRWSLFGSTSEIVERIDKYRRAGVDSIKIVSASADQKESARIFAKEIRPSLS